MKSISDEINRIVEKCKNEFATKEEFEFIEEHAPMFVFVGSVTKNPEKFDQQDD